MSGIPFLVISVGALALVVALGARPVVRLRLVLVLAVQGLVMALWAIGGVRGDGMFVAAGPAAAVLLYSPSPRAGLLGLGVAALGVLGGIAGLLGARAPLGHAATVIVGAAIAVAFLLRPAAVSLRHEARTRRGLAVALVAASGGVVATFFVPSLGEASPFLMGFGAVLVATRTGDGRILAPGRSVVALVIAALATGAVVLAAESPASGIAVVLAAAAPLGGAFILAPRLAISTRVPSRAPTYSDMVEAPHDVSNEALRRLPPLVSSAQPGHGAGLVVMSRVSAHALAEAAVTWFAAQDEATPVQTDAAGAPVDLDLDADAHLVTDVLVSLLAQAAPHADAPVRLVLGGSSHTATFEVHEAQAPVAGDESAPRPRVPPRVVPFRDRGVPSPEVGAARAQYVAERHGGTLSTYYEGSARVLRLSLPRRHSAPTPHEV